MKLLRERTSLVVAWSGNGCVVNKNEGMARTCRSSGGVVLLMALTKEKVYVCEKTERRRKSKRKKGR
jgi:hypothetical protein